MSTNQAVATKTPGFNCRLVIFFATNKHGRRQAFRWSGMQQRAFRMPLADAELFVAQDQATKVHCHPMKPCTTCDGES